MFLKIFDITAFHRCFLKPLGMMAPGTGSCLALKSWAISYKVTQCTLSWVLTHSMKRSYVGHQSANEQEAQWVNIPASEARVGDYIKLKLEHIQVTQSRNWPANVWVNSDRENEVLLLPRSHRSTLSWKALVLSLPIQISERIFPKLFDIPSVDLIDVLIKNLDTWH